MAESKRLAYELRKSHFKLGYEPHHSGTTYKASYFPLAPQPNQDNSNNSSGHALRACHFILGTDKTEHNSSYVADFKEKRGECVALNKSVMADLRAAHYELGYGKSDYGTIYEKTYTKPDPSQTRQTYLAQKKLRERPSDNTFFAVNKTYADSRDDAKKPKGLSKSFIGPSAGGKEPMTKEEIRETHFRFGNDPSVYVTTKAISHVPFNVPNIPSRKQNPQTNIPFQDPFSAKTAEATSVAHTTYVKLPFESQKISSDKTKDSRAAHFSFGHYTEKPTTISKIMYTKPEFSDITSTKQSKNDSKSSHISYLFDPNQSGNEKKIGISMYQEQMKAKELVAERRGQSADPHKAQFVLGYSGSVVKSEASEKYTRPNVEAMKGNKESYKSLLRKNHFDFPHSTCENEKYVVSHSKAVYVPHVNNISSNYAKALEEERNYLKKAHFSMGAYNGAMVTTKQLGFAYGKVQPAALNKDQINDLKKEHFTLGCDKNVWDTQYRYEHGKKSEFIKA